MAGMFYNLDEVMEKLSLTEDQVKQLVQDGKIREFRDSREGKVILLFKAGEVDDLANEIPDADISNPGSEVELVADQTGESSAVPEVSDISQEPQEAAASGEIDISAGLEDIVPEEPAASGIASEPREATDAAQLDETDIAADLEEISNATKLQELDAAGELAESDILAGLQETVSGIKPLKQEPPLEPDQSEAELNIADITGSNINLGELTGADTNITTAGINVLAETEDDYQLAEDTKAETQIADAPEQSEDLDTLGSDLSLDNLDSVGSGSGLLDLSLQADDTSLGAVLDDILPSAGEAPAAATPQEALQAQSAGQIFEEAEADSDAAVLPAQTQVLSRTVYPPDAVSTACGIVLLLPLFAMIYAAIVLVSSFMGIKPMIISKVEATGWYDITIIWYIMTGLAVLSVLIIGLAGLMGGKKGKSKK